LAEAGRIENVGWQYAQPAREQNGMGALRRVGHVPRLREDM
jgi:hypothetical protein